MWQRGRELFRSDLLPPNIKFWFFAYVIILYRNELWGKLSTDEMEFFISV